MEERGRLVRYDDDVHRLLGQRKRPPLDVTGHGGPDFRVPASGGSHVETVKPTAYFVRRVRAEQRRRPR